MASVLQARRRRVLASIYGGSPTGPLNRRASMTRITCSILAALVSLAIVAPVATAMPDRDTIGTSTAGTTVPADDVRSADARDAGVTTTAPQGLPTWPVDPAPITPAAVDTVAPNGDDGTSPLVYILPAVLVSVLLAAGMGYAVRTSVRAWRARVRV
jgi:hypothetical protein